MARRRSSVLRDDIVVKAGGVDDPTWTEGHQQSLAEWSGQVGAEADPLAAIGDAARSGGNHEQRLKWVWHLLARFGGPADERG